MHGVEPLGQSTLERLALRSRLDALEVRECNALLKSVDERAYTAWRVLLITGHIEIQFQHDFGYCMPPTTLNPSSFFMNDRRHVIGLLPALLDKEVSLHDIHNALASTDDVSQGRRGTLAQLIYGSQDGKLVFKAQDAPEAQ